MENVNESTGGATEATESQSTETTASEAVDQTSGAQSAKEETGGASNVAGENTSKTDEVAAEAAKYNPNFAFKVKDKEHQFDDFIKAAIRDAETEKKARELYEKAYGLDEVKAHRQSLQEKLSEISPKYETVEKSLKALGSFVQKKDYRSFFDALQIPKQDIIRYAVEELKYQELPPEQRAAIEEQRQREQQFALAQESNQTLQQQIQTLHVKQAEFELSTELSRPEVSSAAQAFDARVGKPGAFKSEVIRRGAYYEGVLQQNVSAKQIVDEMIGIAGVAPQASPAGAQSATQAQAPKPVIKNFNGSSTSTPTKKVFTSIDEIRKHRQNMADASN